MSSNYKTNQKLDRFSDAFNNLVTRGTINKLDIPSDKPFSEERMRLFVDGDRVLTHYDEDGNGVFTDQPSFFEAEVPEDTEVVMRSAEKQRYIVGFSAEWSNAFKLSRELEGNEFCEIMLSNDNSFENGHGIRFEADRTFMFERRSGTNLEEVEIDLRRGITDFTRFEHRYNWYNVGNYEVKQTFTENGEQFNQTLDKLSVDGERGSENSSGYISTRVYRETGSDPLILEHGSLGFNILADAESSSRGKSTIREGLSHTGNGEYEPLFAARIKRSMDTVTAQLDNIVPINGSESILVAASFDSSKVDVDEQEWGAPTVSNGANNAIEINESVNQFADNNGNMVSSTANPGGFQLGLANIDVEGQGSGETEETDTRLKTSPILFDDVVVVLAKTSEAGDFTVRFNTEQEW